MTLEPALALERSFLDLVAKADDAFIARGLATRTSSPAVLESFRYSPRKEAILRDIEFMISVLETPRESFLSRFFDAFDMKLKDETFEKVIGEDDLFEIYNAEGIQIFRSLNYFQYCPYTLAEVLTFSWNELFDRPSTIVGQLFEVTKMLFEPDAKTIAYTIPEYAITTRLTDSKSFLLKMKYVTPLKCRKTGETLAFLTTAGVRRTDNNIRYI